MCSWSLPLQGSTLAAWIVPPVAFALAIAALLLTLKWMRMSAEAERRLEEEEAVGNQQDYVSRIEDALGFEDTAEGGSGQQGEGRSEGTRQT